MLIQSSISENKKRGMFHVKHPLYLCLKFYSVLTDFVNITQLYQRSLHWSTWFARILIWCLIKFLNQNDVTL